MSPPDINALTDPIAAVISVGLVAFYHLFLVARVRKDPAYTMQALLNKGRVAWIERMMTESEGILAVQSLRNAVMGATFFASTSVLLIMGALTLVVQADRLWEAWNKLNPFTVTDERIWLVKLLLLLVDLLVAFGCFAQVIRLLSHTSILVSVPTATVPAAVVSRIMIQAGRFHTRGMRCYY